MRYDAFKNYYLKNKMMDDFDQAALFLQFQEKTFGDLDDISKDKIDLIIENMVEHQTNDYKHFLILMRYYKIIGHDDIYIYLTQFTGMYEVIDTIIKRLKSCISKDKVEKILDGYDLPYLGQRPKDLPQYTNELMERLHHHLSDKDVEKVLTGNNHQLSKSSQMSEKLAYEEADSFEAYLKERHQRKVDVLKKHMEDNEIWFEQRITPDVIDFVKSNQEILSGVIEGNQLMITKIPYDTPKYLNAKTPQDKQYYACHCPLARESILEGKKVSDQFCYCSAGFAKFPFEVILDQKLSIKVLESALAGDERCRFAIDLEGVQYIQ
mgnify:CR=1 FL=1